MVSPVSTDLLNEVVERATSMVMDDVGAMLALLLDSHGRAFGDVDLAREDRIAYVVDLAQRGVLDVMEVSFPTQFQKIKDQYMRDIKASGLV